MEIFIFLRRIGNKFLKSFKVEIGNFIIQIEGNCFSPRLTRNSTIKASQKNQN
jgi:hypothetical protein